MSVAARALDVTEELSRAAESGDVETLARLLPRVADVNARNRHGTTALMKAASCGHAEIVRLLLEHGADPNLRRNDKFTALVLAAFFGHTETVKTLMEFGARTADVTRSGASAHTWATARTFAEVARCLDAPSPKTSQPQVQVRRTSPRSRIFPLAVIATFIVIVCGGLGALVLRSSEARDLPPAPSHPQPPPPKVEAPIVENAVTTIPQPEPEPEPEPPAPKRVVNEAPRPAIRKTSARKQREVASLQVVSEKPAEEVKISEPPVVAKPKPKLDSPKPVALSPQIMAPTKKAKVIQWP